MPLSVIRWSSISASREDCRTRLSVPAGIPEILRKDYRSARLFLGYHLCCGLCSACCAARALNLCTSSSAHTRSLPSSRTSSKTINRAAAPILPHDRVINRPAGLAIPSDCGFVLIGDAERGHIAPAHVGFAEYLDRRGQLRCEDVVGIVLDPAGVRENLAELVLCDTDDVAVVSEQNGPGTGRSLIESYKRSHKCLSRM
jgi:hypothetical protein